MTHSKALTLTQNVAKRMQFAPSSSSINNVRPQHVFMLTPIPRSTLHMLIRVIGTLMRILIMLHLRSHPLRLNFLATNFVSQ